MLVKRHITQQMKQKKIMRTLLNSAAALIMSVITLLVSCRKCKRLCKLRLHLEFGLGKPAIFRHNRSQNGSALRLPESGPAPERDQNDFFRSSQLR